jgi:hypothetical protein
MPQAAEYVRGVAGQHDPLASRMRERSVDDLIAQTADFLRGNDGSRLRLLPFPQEFRK